MDVKTAYYTDNYLSVPGISVGKKMYRVLKSMSWELGWAGLSWGAESSAPFRANQEEPLGECGLAEPGSAFCSALGTGPARRCGPC